MDNNDRKGSVALAFLVGAMAGGIAALLFTPQTGAQMRGRLQRGANDLREKGGRLARETGEKAGTISGAVRGAASEARSTYREELERRRVASGAETRHAVETEMAGNKPRTGPQI